MTGNPTPEAVTLYADDATGATVALRARVRRHYPERFLTMFTPTLATLAQMDRPPAYHRALFHLLTVLDPIQFRRVSAREVAQGSGLSVSSAERALAMLEADRVILSNGHYTGAKARRLNNQVAWGSSVDAFNATERDPEVIDARGR